jgi:hypothetical protein
VARLDLARKRECGQVPNYSRVNSFSPCTLSSLWCRYLRELIRVTRTKDARPASTYTSTRPSVRARAAGTCATRFSWVSLSALRPRPPYRSRSRSASAAQRLHRSASTRSVPTPLSQTTRWCSSGERGDPQKSHTSGAAAVRTSASRPRFRLRMVLALRTISTARSQWRSPPIQRTRRSSLIWRLHERGCNRSGGGVGSAGTPEGGAA